MKLKALLLGSAAAMIAVSGAHAADAVVAEPEPVDYVKVCDMYGAGFFYIPGTENCLAIGGYVRVEYDYSDIDNAAPATGSTVINGATVSTRLTFDARSETDYGTLRGYARIDGSQSNDNATRMNVTTDLNFSNIYIELGHFSTGLRETRTALAAGYGIYDGDDQNAGNMYYVDYTWAANGLSIVAGTAIAQGWADDHNAYIRADYSGSMYTIAASVLHEFHDRATNDSEQEYNIWAEVRPMDGIGVRAYYNDDSRAGNNNRWGVGVNFAVMDDVALSANYWDTNGTGTGISGQIAWTIAPDLSLTFAAQQLDNDNGADQTDVKVRLNRSF